MQCSEKWSATVNQPVFLNHLYRCALPWIQPAFGTNCQLIPWLQRSRSPEAWVHAWYHMKLHRYHTEVWGHCVTWYYRCPFDIIDSVVCVERVQPPTESLCSSDANHGGSFVIHVSLSVLSPLDNYQDVYVFMFNYVFIFNIIYYIFLFNL